MNEYQPSIRPYSAPLEIVILLFVLLSPMNALSAPKSSQEITLVGTNGTNNSSHGTLLTLIYTEAFRRLGYKLRYYSFPAKRASHLSDSGQVDGEIHRVAGYGENHQNLIKVEESHFSIHFSAYGTDTSIQLFGWDSLIDSNFIVGYRRGVQRCELILPTLLPKERLVIVNSTEQGLRQVLGGRSKIFIDVELLLNQLIDQREFKKENLRKLGIMEKIDTHAFLHKRHVKLVPKLSSVLRKMKHEGLIKKYKSML